jgi:hypothetical protein
MKNTLVVVADLGCFKAFKLNHSEIKGTPRLELLEHVNNAQAHEYPLDRASDSAGRFPRGRTPGGAVSASEQHNLELEWRKRFVRQLADRLSNLARVGGMETCLLAATKEIKHQLLDELDATTRGKITQVVAADLTRVERSEILRHFQG